VPIEVTMPKLSPTMESGVITQWLVKVGDQIHEGDVLADVETDKATMQMKAYDEGIVAQLDHNVGDEVALGQRVLVLARKGEDPKQVAEGLAGKKAGPEKRPPKDKDARRGPEPSGSGAAEKAEGTAPAARANGQGQGQGQGQEPEAPPADRGGRVKASPLARKIAAAAQLDLSRVKGSGPGGRVIREDVEAFLAGRGMGEEPDLTERAPATGTKLPAAAAVATALHHRATERIPHTRMRKTIASRMVDAKATAPEIHVTVEIRVDALVATRERLNAQLAPEKIKLSVGDFVTKAAALALRRHPGVNATFEPDAIVRHGAVNIGIAVALEGGLIVPVVRDADLLGLREIRVQTEAVTSAARQNKLTPEQMTGGTFTISNMGMYGVRQFDAIINLPEVAILAVASAEKRPVVEGDRLTVGTVMAVTLTADHRAVDGAMAAEFLRTLKGFLEEPASMLL
jgi:pyruvate dehydrogenase E2 component (dihydrolipoamide acetyltransferase)